MPDDVLGPEDIVVDERKVADTRHDKLKRDTGAAGATSRHEDFDIGKESDVEESLDSLESPVIHRASVLSGHSPVFRHAA
jgi:hypothetical protein